MYPKNHYKGIFLTLYPLQDHFSFPSLQRIFHFIHVCLYQGLNVSRHARLNMYQCAILVLSNCHQGTQTWVKSKERNSVYSRSELTFTSGASLDTSIPWQKTESHITTWTLEKCFLEPAFHVKAKCTISDISLNINTYKESLSFL